MYMVMHHMCSVFGGGLLERDVCHCLEGAKSKESGLRRGNKINFTGGC